MAKNTKPFEIIKLKPERHPDCSDLTVFGFFTDDRIGVLSVKFGFPGGHRMHFGESPQIDDLTLHGLQFIGDLFEALKNLELAGKPENSRTLIHIPTYMLPILDRLNNTSNISQSLLDEVGNQEKPPTWVSAFSEKAKSVIETKFLCDKNRNLLSASKRAKGL